MPYSKSPNSDMVIYRVVYCDPNDWGRNYIINGGTTDVKDQRVLNRFFDAMDNARPYFPCCNDVFETDPAPGARKISTVEYAVNKDSRYLKQSVFEYECFNFRYHVTNITYGGVPITAWDVYDKFNRALRGASFVMGGRQKNGSPNGIINDAVEVSNTTFGFDPDPGNTKQMKIQIGWNMTPGCRELSRLGYKEGLYWPDAANYWEARSLDDGVQPSYSVSYSTPGEPSWDWYKAKVLRTSKL